MATEINESQNYTPKPKKRLLFVITQSEFGGAQRFLHALVSHLDKNNYEINIAAGQSVGKDFLIEALGELGLKVNRLQNLGREISFIEDIKATSALRKIIRVLRPDVLFLLSSKAGFLGSLAAKLEKSPAKVIYRIGGWSFNDPWPKWKKNLFRFMEKISAHWKDIIVVNSKYDFDQALKLKIRPRQKLVLIHNGLDPYKTKFLAKEEARLKLFEQISKKAGRIFQAETIVGTIANFYPAKGLDTLIEAAINFKDRDDIFFVIIGDGPLRIQLETLINQKGLDKKVFLLGQIPQAYQMLCAFDIFILPSVKEGFPWSLIEAMAAKLPVIASIVGAIPEIIEDGKNGFLVTPGEAQKISRLIEKIAADDRLKQELSIQAHQTILLKFDLNRMVEKVEELF